MTVASSGLRGAQHARLKAFVGTGIMFLPKAFNNGGILFSSITMLIVSAVTMIAFHILLDLKKL